MKRSKVKKNHGNNINLMRALSGTAVRVDNTRNEMQVDLSPCQHLSLPTQSLIQRQPNRGWGILCTLHAVQQTRSILSLCLSTARPLIHPLGAFVCFSPARILTGHLDFCAPLQKGPDPIPHDAAVEASVRAVQRRDEVPLMITETHK